MKILLTSALLLVLGSGPAFKQKLASTSKPVKTTAAEIENIHDLYVFDQQLPGPGHATLEEHLHAEAGVIAQARNLLRRGLVQTGVDNRDAAWLFQHGENPKDYLLAHVLAVRAMALGETTASWIAAATLDRYLQSIGKEQIFGTQYSAGAISGPNGGAKSAPSSTRTQAPFDPTLGASAASPIVLHSQSRPAREESQ